MSRPKKHRRPRSRAAPRPTPSMPQRSSVTHADSSGVSPLNTEPAHGHHTLGPVHLNRHHTPKGYRVGLAKNDEGDADITYVLSADTDAAVAAKTYREAERLLEWLGFDAVEEGGGLAREPDGTWVDSVGSTWEITVACPAATPT